MLAAGAGAPGFVCFTFTAEHSALSKRKCRRVFGNAGWACGWSNGFFDTGEGVRREERGFQGEWMYGSKLGEEGSGVWGRVLGRN
jgi:hypothetical protein